MLSILPIKMPKAASAAGAQHGAVIDSFVTTYVENLAHAVLSDGSKPDLHDACKALRHIMLMQMSMPANPSGTVPACVHELCKVLVGTSSPTGYLSHAWLKPLACWNSPAPQRGICI